MNGIAALLSSTFDVGLMACLSIAFGFLSRLIPFRQSRSVVLGAMFGVMSIISSLHHTALGDTVLIDSSPMFAGFAAAFLGPLGTAATLATIGVLGIPLDTNSGVGWLQLVLTSLAGGLWSTLMRGWDRRRLRALLMLGVLVSGALLPGYILLGGGPLVAPGPAVLVSLGINLVVATMLGSFIERERAMWEGEQQLRMLADTDPLTGLHNRRTIISAFANRAMDGVGQALLLIDVDHFKSINDAHGHSAGDKVLRQIADQLRNSVRAGDIVSRYGGEEFAILLVAATPEEATTAAERLRRSIERHRVSIGQLAVQVTASIGVVWWLGGADFEDKFKAADQALYRAKVEGRNRVVTELVAAAPDADVIVGAPS
jgi:diguanylate cyclase